MPLLAGWYPLWKKCNVTFHSCSKLIYDLYCTYQLICIKVPFKWNNNYERVENPLSLLFLARSSLAYNDCNHDDGQQCNTRHTANHNPQHNRRQAVSFLLILSRFCICSKTVDTTFRSHWFHIYFNHLFFFTHNI